MLPKNKAFGKLIMWIDKKLVFAHNKRRSFNFRNYCVITAKARFVNNATGKFASNDTLNNDRFPELDFAPCMMNCQPAAYACTCWRTVNFSVGKNTDIAAVRTCRFRFTYKNCPVKKT